MEIAFHLSGSLVVNVDGDHNRPQSLLSLFREIP